MLGHLKHDWRDWALLSVVALAVVAWSAPQLDLGFKSPDAMQEFHFSHTYAETGDLVHEDEAYDVGGEWVRPRGTHIVNDQVVMGKFVGFALVTGTFGSVLPEGVLYFVPVTAGFAAVFVAFLTRAFFPGRTPYVAGALAVLAPPMWYWASIPMTSSVYAGAAFIGGFALLFHHVRNPQAPGPILLALAAALMATGLAIRPDGAFYLLAAIFGALVALWKRVPLWQTLVGGAVGAVGLLPFLVTNWRLYGSPLKTGQAIGHHWEGSTPEFAAKKDVTFLRYVPENLGDLVGAFPLFLLCLVAFALVVRAHKGRFLAKPQLWLYLVALFGGLVGFGWMYLSVPPGGRLGIISYGSPIERSMIRYFLALYLLAIPALAYFVTHLLPDRRAGVMRLAAILLVLAFAVSAVTVTAREVKSAHNDQLELAGFANGVIKATDEDGVLIVDRRDKALFPHRSVLPLARIEDNATLRTVVPPVLNLTEGGIPVYLTETLRLSNRQLETALAPHGYRLELIPGPQRLWLVVPE